LDPVSPFYPSRFSTLTAATIGHQVRHDQGNEQEQAEDEEQQPAVPLSARNTSWPERQRHQNDKADYADRSPARRGYSTNHQ
jgi:hypothetical protein